MLAAIQRSTNSYSRASVVVDCSCYYFLFMHLLVIATSIIIIFSATTQWTRFLIWYHRLGFSLGGSPQNRVLLTGAVRVQTPKP